MAEAELNDDEPIHAYIPPRPIMTLPEQTVMMTDAQEEPQNIKWEPSDLTDSLLLAGNSHTEPNDTFDSDEIGSYVEFCYEPHMTAAIVEDDVEIQDGHIVTLRVYHSVAAKRAVFVKDDDL